MEHRNTLALRSLLFANQNLENLSVEAELQAQAATADTWRKFALAKASLEQNDVEKAVDILRGLSASGEIGTRSKLWAWFNLRRFGIFPDVLNGSVVRGVVLEVRVDGGTDVLAAYDDNSARYLNYSGKLIVWDTRDAGIDTLNRNILLIAAPAVDFAITDDVESPLTSGLRVTVLTYNGNHRVEGNPGTQSANSEILGRLLKAGAMLMVALINRAKSTSDSATSYR
jgi:hypothetical protein